MEKPRLWKATNEMMYPLGGRGTDSSPGTFHSTASVSGGRCPTSMRRCIIEWVMMERDQFDMVMASFRV
jgi:hypothetical protein